MFDPEKLSPLPWHFDEWHEYFSDIKSADCDVAENMSKDDAEFFVMARKCYDIGERRGWYVCRETCVPQGRTPEWSVCFHRDEMPDVFWMTTRTQAEAMALMIAADEWMTNKEKDAP